MLHEIEIIACLRENLRKSVESCELLATVPNRGEIYRDFREQLSLIEGASRQLGCWREDGRWFDVPLWMEETKKRALSWILRYPRTENSNQACPLFTKLADNLRKFLKRALELETKVVGCFGPVLPMPLPAPTRTQGRAVQVNRTAGGIILPNGVSLQ
jgi:hypothetical protein